MASYMFPVCALCENSDVRSACCGLRGYVFQRRRHRRELDMHGTAFATRESREMGAW